MMKVTDEELENEIRACEEKEKVNAKMPNSYGKGFDAGWLAALRYVRDGEE